MQELIQQYFVDPIWQRSGYNAVNTLVYAAIALAIAWVLYKLLRRERIAIDEKFVVSIIPFILFGSTARVITDAVDTGVMELYRGNPIVDFVLNSGIYAYSYLTVTPGIYVLVGAITIAAVFGFNRMKRPELIAPLGIVLWLSQLLLLSPILQFWSYTIMALALALGGTYAGYLILKQMKVDSLVGNLVIFGHALDGASTFVIIDVFGPAVGKNYFEQHVLSRAIGALGDSMFIYFLVKVAFATAAMIAVEKDSENAQEKLYIALLLLIFGLAPGVRDVLRMLAGA
ncbi:hypothetical protein DRN67_03145 [Candidatus Micrarchaeota archaeon]|mgnify:CR=1 FL=1|nr:MAG: hypothetical protein DRN67_03145 [Candidatus Micrarchaeota archaeon]